MNVRYRIAGLCLAFGLANNSFVQLRIRDVRSGRIYFRGTYVDYGSGQVEHYFATSRSGGDKPQFDAAH